MILKIIDFLRKISEGTEDFDESVSRIDSFLTKIERESTRINLPGIIDDMLGDEDPPEVIKLITLPDGQDLTNLINHFKNELVEDSSNLLDEYMVSGDSIKVAKKLYEVLFSTMRKLRSCINRRKKNEKEYLETKTASKKKFNPDFIQKAVKKPGSLRKHYGVEEGEDIPVGKARKDYSTLRKKAKDGKLTKSELSLLRKLSLYLNVLRPASQKQKD